MWMSAMGMKPEDCKPDKSKMMKGLVLTVIGTFLTTFVLAHSTQVWRGSVWNVGSDGPGYIYGFYGGFFTWLGFYVPMQFSKVSWEGRSWKLFALNAAHDFVNLQLIAQILSNWR
jgi:hypothetical protein